MQPEEGSRVTACERCRNRKAKCDKVQPSCSACVKAATQCVYSFRDASGRRHYTEELERRLRRAESRNKALQRQLYESQHRSNVDDAAESITGGNFVDDADGVQEHNRERQNSHVNEVASQVSSLSLSAGGQRHFLGSASGFLLASLLQVKPSPTGDFGGVDVSLSRRFGVEDGKSRITAPKGTALPPEELARSLLRAYLLHGHLSYPILHPGLLEKAFDAIYSEPAFYETHHWESFTFDIVLAIGTAEVHKFAWQVLPDAETHFDRAMSRLSHALERGGIAALQVVLLVCQYRMLSAACDTSASLWHLIGIAARMCFELGLHRESVYSIQDVDPQRAKEQRESCEVKRRCFWCAFAMDRIASAVLGRPLAIHLDDVDTELPQVDGSAHASPSDPPSPTESFASPQWQSRNALFVHIVRYRAICGKILTLLHNTTRKRRQLADHSVIQQELGQELAAWRSATDLLPLIEINAAGDQDKSSFRSREWYELLYHNGVLMLHRPSTTIHDIPRSGEIVQSIFQAAQQSIATYASLYRSRKINYSWVTLHAVFIAGLSYIYAVRLHFQTRRRDFRASLDRLQNGGEARLHSDPSIGQIANDTRACSTVLVALSERWGNARPCHDVFGRLTDAVLADAVGFYTQPPQEMQSLLYPAATDQWDPNPDGSTQIFVPAIPPDIVNGYQDCFIDLDEIFGSQYNDAPMMQIPQDWLFEIQALS